MRENFVLHRLHSLSGIVPVGFYMVQHLTLNSFALLGPDRFNGVIGFFAAMPAHILLALEIGVIAVPLLFHAVYGLYIVARAEPNYSQAAYKFRENRYYMWQRWSGIAAFLFLCTHVATTTMRAKVQGHEAIRFHAMAETMAWPNNLHLGLVFYALGVAACSYHLAYGIWNFCIRWGITINPKSQEATGRFAAGAFVVLTLIGWSSLVGFVNPRFQTEQAVVRSTGVRQAPASYTP
ncbi:MAG: succinate dehydrogenase [Armatimonadetes bacterium]|nr:succinate dehydrogenase [Armatimonadota bacterium]